MEYYNDGEILSGRLQCHDDKSTLHKKQCFPLRISSVNVTKSAGNCGFGHITEEILNGKLRLLCSGNEKGNGGEESSSEDIHNINES